MNTLRILQGPSMVVMGLCFLYFACRLWLTKPINHAFWLGPFLTERGLSAILRSRMPVMSFALFLIFGGSASTYFWFVKRDINNGTVAFLGSLGASLGIWAGIMAISLVVRAVRVK